MVAGSTPRDVTRRPLLVPPAMSDLMYAHPPMAPGPAVVGPLRTRLTIGYVLGEAAAGERPLRPVITVLRDIPPLPHDLVALARGMSDYSPRPAGEAAALLTGWLGEGSARLSVVLPPAERRRPGSARRVRLRVHPALWSPSPNGRRDVLLLG